MRNPKLLVTLFLMIMLALTLQAQNHQSHGNGNSHQGNYQPNHNDNENDYQPIRAYKGILVKCDSENNNEHGNYNDNEEGNQQNYGNHDQNNHQNYGNNEQNNHNWNAAYGIVLKNGGSANGFYRFDARGNELVKEILRRHQNSRDRMMVQVKGSTDHNGIIHVASLKWIGRPNNHESGFAWFFNNHRHPNWSFDLFVRF